MNINPLWFLCLTIRLVITLLLWFFNKSNYGLKNKIIIKTISIIFLFIIGLGFIRKGYFGSNNEMQISKVFWHETRYVHGIIYILSGIYLLNNNLNISSLLLLLDVIFSILYRVLFNK